MTIFSFQSKPWHPACVALLLAFCAALPTAVQAARPLNTDDANVVDPKSCQLETWVRRTRSSTEQWAIPGCNFWGDVEWSLGGQQRSEDTPWASGLLLGQAKKRWLPLSPRWIAISEVYAETTTPSQYQVGLRFWVKPQRVQIDTTYGNVVGSASDQQWLSIGLRWLTPAFLP